MSNQSHLHFRCSSQRIAANLKLWILSLSSLECVGGAECGQGCEKTQNKMLSRCRETAVTLAGCDLPLVPLSWVGIMLKEDFWYIALSIF
ncbi:hypothetical protein GN956_G17657 [Arapaima gigas]